MMKYPEFSEFLMNSSKFKWVLAEIWQNSDRSKVRMVRSLANRTFQLWTESSSIPQTESPVIIHTADRILIHPADRISACLNRVI
jgi:hypothetical protein